jgi:signal transduction histidine kinase
MRMVQKEMATESQRHREEMKPLRNLRFFLRFLCDSVSLWPILCPNVVWFDLDADFEARSRNRSVRLVTKEDITLVGNQQLLHSAIENVVRNAVSYTAEGNAVEVSLEGEEVGETDVQTSRAVIRVLDQGIGVPQAALADIFRPFYRVADARDRQSGGTGLGLSISQRAVQIHGGTVTATNAPNGGLLVELALPLAKERN